MGRCSLYTGASHFLHILLSTSNDVPSPRGNAGRGKGRGVRLVVPPLPQNRTTDGMHRLRCCPLLHKYVEERELREVVRKGRCARRTSSLALTRVTGDVRPFKSHVPCHQDFHNLTLTKSSKARCLRTR